MLLLTFQKNLGPVQWDYIQSPVIFSVFCFDIKEVPRSPWKWNWHCLIFFLSFSLSNNVLNFARLLVSLLKGPPQELICELFQIHFQCEVLICCINRCLSENSTKFTNRTLAVCYFLTTFFL